MSLSKGPTSQVPIRLSCIVVRLGILAGGTDKERKHGAVPTPQASDPLTETVGDEEDRHEPAVTRNSLVGRRIRGAVNMPKYHRPGLNHRDVLAAERKERARIRSEKGIHWGGRPALAA
ncbi:hypothetical protein GCM10010406_51270 [Streptomyces thermolineatus]|uniref:Uncharacterized protein n=1 Tax=Streptomyces thermolineatus TaxID=44033 RepID=A0ABN3MUS6_9ACTN